jgi:hypothetical protein
LSIALCPRISRACGYHVFRLPRLRHARRFDTLPCYLDVSPV